MSVTSETPDNLQKDSVSSNHSRRKRKIRDSAGSDFENMTKRSIPNWNAVWNLLLQSHREREKREEKLASRVSSVSSAPSSSAWKENPIDLRKKIQKKIMELVNDEETLVHLYMKAAESARERQEELKMKMSSMVEQIRKDRFMMKLIKEL